VNDHLPFRQRARMSSYEKWDYGTCNTIAHRLCLLAKHKPRLYAHFKAWEAYYLSREMATGEWKEKTPTKPAK
jgi:hypothetical protein